MTRIWFTRRPVRAVLTGALLALAATMAPGLSGGAAQADPTALRAVDIARWTPEHRTAEGQTQLVAQVDFSTQLILREEGRTAFVMPLLAPNAAADDPQVYGALVYPGLRTLDDPRLDALLETTLAMGARGPIVRLSADMLAGAPFSAPLAAAMAGQGRTLTAVAPMLHRIDPPAPGIAWTPLLATAAALLLFLSLVARMRSRRRAAALPQALAGAHHRIPAYVPEMANGVDGSLALARVIGPFEIRREVARRPLARAAAAPGKAARRGAGNPLFAAVRLGENWGEGLKLSGRALSRLNADPFVQRLGRLG